ncbi:PREDICTED: BTB/POZ domain-containing protein At5g17580-like isoform X2 [Nelumbo nucifera]|nr:PREDICTED: BTB/POZ domain-containing protein At5g17580-like isoform X2 [Nelumbo nucifera]DAD22488.1 TPA_asm: hypothetical protein HUJ06_023951 [Nelumbo nucifera]
MTDDFSPNNLYDRCLSFMEQWVFPSWNESIKAFQSTELVIRQALELGLINSCLDSIVSKAISKPDLLGKPIKNPMDGDSGDGKNGYYPSARRRLYVPDWKQDQLITLTLQHYLFVMTAMIHKGIQSEYITGCLLRYLEKWVYCVVGGVGLPLHKKREVIEQVEKLLPDERELVPFKYLSEMLRSAITLQASLDCRNRLEIRMGKKLNEATVVDLLIPSQGYAREEKYDTECIGRIVKSFYANYNSSDSAELVGVTELIEEFLSEVASDVALKKDTFISLAEMAIATSLGIQRNTDGIYRAIDIYLGKHGYLTETEREEVCRVLDCHKMSQEAREHARQNERLPLRVVVQVLYVGHLQLRDAIANGDMLDSYGRCQRVEGGENAVVGVDRDNHSQGTAASEEELLRAEMKDMDDRVMELEKECCRMRIEMEKSGGGSHSVVKKKGSMWKQLKRKFGCIRNSMHECNCQVKKKKVHPKNCA